MISAERKHARKLILQALNLNRALPEPETVEQMQVEDWACLLKTAHVHRLGPMLHDRLARGDLADVVPRRVKDQLKAMHRKNAIRNLKVYRELVNVTRLLEAENISSIALKGAFLAQFSYAEPGLRPMRDVDLLLHAEQAVQAFDFLKTRGYRSLFDGEPDAYFADRIHLPPLMSRDGIAIELHHRLTEPDVQLTCFENELWMRSISRGIGGTQIRFLCPQDMLLHLCIHATLDHRLDLGPLALVDVAFLVETQQIDWIDFMALVSGNGWQRAVMPLLDMARRHLGAKIPDAVMTVLGGEEGAAAWQDAADYLIFSDPEDHKLLDYGMQEVIYGGSLPARISALAGVVFPRRTTIARHFPVNASSPLAYLYYPRRWYRMITGKLPLLLKAHAARKQSIRELSGHRSILNNWLHNGPFNDGHTSPARKI